MATSFCSRMAPGIIPTPSASRHSTPPPPRSCCAQRSSSVAGCSGRVAYQPCHGRAGSRRRPLAVTRASSEEEQRRASSEQNGEDDKDKQLFTPKDPNNRNFLIKYVSEVEPTVIDSFKNSAPDHVTEAMRHAIQSLLGSLPREFFEVTISTIGDNLRSLMYSFIMTGYLFRTVEYHLELQNGLESALPASVLETGSGELPDEERAAAGWRREDQGKFAEGVNKSRLSGEVTRWRHGLGPETVGAMEYVTALENEIERLKERVAEVQDDSDEYSSNVLMDYIIRNPDTNIYNLKASPEVTEAMEVFLCRLLGTSDSQELSSYRSENSSQELARLLSWLMVVGYTLRSMEVRFSMESSYKLPHVSLEV